MILPSSTTNKPQLITSYKKPDNLMIRILNLLKNNSRNLLTIGYYRIKSLCSNSYISFRKSTVVANVNEDKAFSSKQCKNKSFYLPHQIISSLYFSPYNSNY